MKIPRDSISAPEYPYIYAIYSAHRHVLFINSEADRGYVILLIF